MDKKLYFGIGGILLALVVSQTPVRQHRVLSYGIDAYNAHHSIFSKKIASQTITTQDPITGIGAILVNLRRSKQLTNGIVEVIDPATQEKLISQIIPKESIQDDQFTYVNFKNTPIAQGRTIQIIFSAPDASNQNAIGVRFDPNNGELAMSLKERVPLWRYIYTTIQNNSDNWRYISIALLASFIISLAAFLANKKKAWLGIIGILAIASFGIRSTIIPHFGGVSGGDAYNYLSISHTITQFNNPFVNTKRLPGYPLLLAPFYASGIFDDQRVMRYIQSVGSILGIILIALIARALTLSWPTAIVASAILAFQKDYYFTSLRPEPYALYTTLLLASIFFFFKGYVNKKIWIYVAFGLCLGYGAMVRQEGFLLAAVLGMLSLVYECHETYKQKSWESARASLVRFAWMYLPALCLVLPFFLHNLATYGHPLYTEYFEGDRLQIVDSYPAFLDSLGATWGVIGSMWKPSWDTLERIKLTSPEFIASVAVLWVWYIFLKYFKRTSQNQGVALFIWATWILLALCAIYIKTQVASIIPIVTAAWILASIPLFIIETKWRGLVILLVLVSQLSIATWFHPFPKHYQQSYPLIILALATALISQIPVQKKMLTAGTLALSTLPFFIIAVFLLEIISPMIDKYNEDVALDSVMYRAARTARNLEGPIGFDQAYLPARLYLDPNAKYFPDEENPTQQMEDEWLQDNPIKTMVVTNGNNIFKTVPPTWKKIHEFKAMGKNDTLFVSTIYATPF